MAAPGDLLPEALRPRPGRILTIAHRGDSSRAPENTVPAFDAAVEAGSDLIEFDLQCTADGDAAVIHDGSALRTTGIDAPVARMSAAQLAAADAGSWFGPEFAGTPVPMFGDLAEWAAAHPGIGLLAELKGPWTAQQVTGPVTTLRRHGLAGRVILQSFEPASVAAAAEAAPDLPRALLVHGTEPFDELLRRLAALGAAGCNPQGSLPHLVPGLAARLRDAGYRVFPWTLDEADEWGAAGGAGVDGVITNRPQAFRDWQGRRWRPVTPSGCR